VNLKLQRYQHDIIHAALPFPNTPVLARRSGAMSWWGKIIGGAFGYMLGGPLGALLGAALGHNLDRGLGNLDDLGQGSGTAPRERIQSAFFTATFSVMGHLSKSDGRVSEDEIRMARQVMAQMDLDSSQQRTAMHLFNQGKQAGFPLDQVLEQLRGECHLSTNLLRMFLEIQLATALADGQYDPRERQLLLHICDRLHIPQHDLEQLEALAQASQRQAAPDAAQMSLQQACSMLGVSKDAPIAEVKKAYRRLLSRHHPDKLVSQGLPEEMMKLAAQKTHEIRQAYELIRNHRVF